MFPAPNYPGIIYQYANGMIGGSGSLKDILGNATKENALLQFHLDNGIKGIDLYDVLSGRTTAGSATVLNSADKAALANFIKKARQSYGITEVSLVGNLHDVSNSDLNGLKDYMRAVDYNLTRTDPLEKADYLNIELEFWNWKIANVATAGVGTVSVTAGSRTVTGVGTTFSGGLFAVNNFISINGVVRQITNLIDATHLEVDHAYTAAQTGATFKLGSAGAIDPVQYDTWIYRSQKLREYVQANPSAGLLMHCYLGHPAGATPTLANIVIREIAKFYDRLLPHDYITVSAANGGAPNWGYTSARMDAAGGMSTDFTGTVSSSGATLIGNGTSFLTDLFPGCKVEVGGQVRKVVSIASNTSLTVDVVYSPTIPLGSNYGIACDFMPIVSVERPEEGNNFSGWFMQGFSVTQQAATLVNGSAVVTVTTAAAVVVGDHISCAGFSGLVTVVSKTGTTVTLSATANLSGGISTNQTIFFGHPAGFATPCIPQLYKYYALTGYTGGTGYPTQQTPFNSVTDVRVQRRANLVGLHLFDQSIMRSLSPQPSFCLPAPSCTTPSGLSSASITSTTATLNWTAVSGAAGYNIRYRIVGAGTWINVTSVTNTKAISSLTPSSNYEFEVQTDCGSGNVSAFTSVSTFSTIATPTCSAATGLNVSNIGLTGSTLNWSAVSGAFGYSVRYRVVGNPTWTTVSVAGLSYIITGLTSGTNYEFQVQTDCGGGSLSAFTSSTTWTTLSCGTATGLAASNILQNSVTFSWNNIASAAGYNVQYRVVGNPTWTSTTSPTNSLNISSLTPATNYEFQVQSNCGSGVLSAFSSSTTFTTNPAIPLNVQLQVVKAITCVNSCDGEIVASTTDGTSPYTYSWSDGINIIAITPGIQDLCAGTYTCTITDHNGVTGSSTFVIASPTQVVFTTTVVNVVGCNGATTGSITVNASGGTPPYQYSKNGGSTWQSSNLFTGLAAGTYNIVVRDFFNCNSASAPVVITQPGVLAFTLTTTPISCHNGSDGVIVVNVTGGQAPFQYSIDNGSTWQAGNTFAGLTYSTTYTFKVKDSYGCVTGATFSSLPNPDPLAVGVETIPADTFGYCAEGTTLPITLAAVFVTMPPQPIVYAWSTGENTQTITRTFPLGTTSISVTVTDANGCTATGSQNITIEQDQQLPLPIVLTGAFSACDPSSVITATVDLTPGFDDVIFYFPDGTNSDQGFGNPTSVDLPISYAGQPLLAIATYSNCSTATQIVIPSVSPAVIATATGTDTTCYGCSDGTATVTASLGIAPYSYAWSDGQTTQTATGLAPGAYLVAVTDSGRCVAHAAVIIGSPTGITGVIISDPATCIGAIDGAAHLFDLIGGTFPYTITWNDPNQQTGSDITGLGAGTYIAHVVDANGLTADFTITVAEYQITCPGDQNAGGGSLTPNVYNGDTIAFSKPKNRWVTRYSFVPEFYGSIRNEIVSFLNGDLWLHNANTIYNNFYGNQFNSTLTFVSNKAPLKVKIFKAIAENANTVWAATDLSIPPNTQLPIGMKSHLPAGKFVNKEGKYYSDILRDQNTPYASSQASALIEGRPLRGEAMKVTLENTDTTLAVLMAIEITYIYSEKS